MLNRIYQYITTHKLATFSFFTAWALITIYGLSQLRFEEDITKVLPQNDKTNLTSKVLKQLNFADKISVKVRKFFLIEKKKEKYFLRQRNFDLKRWGYALEIKQKLVD